MKRGSRNVLSIPQVVLLLETLRDRPEAIAGAEYEKLRNELFHSVPDARLADNRVRQLADELLERYLRAHWYESSGRRVSRPPGSTLGSIAEFICSKKTLERIAKPAIADIQYEYFEALAQGRKAKSAWVWIRGLCSFWLALGVFQLTKKVVQVWKRVNFL
jgi:hypothetical protein